MFNISLYKMYADKSITKVLNSKQNKLRYIPITKSSIYALCRLNYEKSEKMVTELTKIFNYNLTKWCNVQIKTLYKVNDNEKICFHNPFLENIIIGSVEIQNNNMNRNLFLICENNNLDSLSYGCIDRENKQLIAVEKSKMEEFQKIQLLKKNQVINNSIWIIESFEVLSSEDVLCKLVKKF